MKKKILATLLAVCLFVGVAVPAVMAANAGDASTQGGTSDEITSLKAAKAAYTIEKGSDINLKDEVLAFCGTKKLCEAENVDFEFEMVDPDLAFSLDTDTGVVVADEEKGTATVVIKANEGKIKTTVKLTAAKAAKDVKATGFIFAESTYTLPVNGTQDASQATIKIIATPKGASFTDAQKAALEAGLYNIGDQNTGLDQVGYAWNDDGEFEIYLGDAMSAVADQKDTFEFAVDFPRNTVDASVLPGDEDYKSTNIVKKTTVKTVEAKDADRVGNSGTVVTIEVGQTKDVSGMFKVGPSDANVHKDVTYSTDYINDEAEYDDFAKVDEDGVITGVAVGENKIVATLDANTDKTSFIKVKVVAAGSIETTPAGKVEAAAKELAIGGTTTVKVTDAEEGAKITWKVSDSKIAQIAPFEGAETKVYAKSAGTVKVTAMVDGVEIGSVEIVVKAATANNNGGTTSNPQTGDSLFANLF